MKRSVLTICFITATLNLWAFGEKDAPVGSDSGIEAPSQSRNEKSLLELAESGDADGIEKLLKVDIDLNATDDSGRTALHAAAEAGNADIAAVLLIRGALVDPPDDLGQTPLLLAVLNGNDEVTELLVHAGADIGHKDNRGRSPASRALDEPSSHLPALLTAENIDSPVIEGSPLLHSAASRGAVSHVEVLLEAGASTTATDRNGGRAIDAALAGPVEIEQARSAALILKAGSPSPAAAEWTYVETPLKTGNTEFRFDYGSTALHIAAERGQEGMLRYLIEIGADLDARDQPGNTALHVAVRRGYRTIARLLLDLGSDVNVKDYNGNAPIHESLTANDGHAMTSMLLDRGANPNIKNGSGSTPLHLCVQLAADVQAARLLLDRGADVDPRDRTGNTPLLLAVENTDRDLAELFLSEGADIFARNNKGLTPAIGALSFGPSVVSWFFTGQRLNQTDNEGRGVLHHAVLLDTSRQTLEVLLQAGADGDLRDFNGESPFHYAVSSANLAQSTVLAEYGADMFLENNAGRTPLILAFENGPEFTRALLADRLDTEDRWGSTALFHAVEWEYDEIVRSLLAAGMDPEHRNRQGITPLHVSVRARDTVIAEILLDAGSSPNTPDYMGRTPLHDAVTWGTLEMVQLLTEAGADPDKSDSTGQTALHMAAFAGNDRITTWLLQSGAYPDAQDDDGRTPLSIAAEADRIDTVRLLLSFHAGLQIRDRQGRTPLHAAVAAGRVETASFLIDEGSDFFALDADGKTPFHLAMNGGPVLLESLMTPQLCREQDNRGNTPLHIAVDSAASPEIIRVLLDNGADRRIRNASGLTAGELAGRLGYTELASMLL